MPIFKLVQEMMFVNTCVKFRDNWLRNEVCRAVMPFQGGRSPLLGGLHVTCDAHVRTRARDDVCERECVKFRDNRLRNEVCRAVTPFEHVRTGRSLQYIPCEGIIKYTHTHIYIHIHIYNPEEELK